MDFVDHLHFMLQAIEILHRFAAALFSRLLL